MLCRGLVDGPVEGSGGGLGAVDPDDDRVTDTVLRLVARRHGSISAEHGIGTAKRKWLTLVRSAAEIDAFRAIKAALDPDNVLNPHVMLPRDEHNERVD